VSRQSRTWSHSVVRALVLMVALLVPVTVLAATLFSETFAGSTAFGWIRLGNDAGTACLTGATTSVSGSIPACAAGQPGGVSGALPGPAGQGVCA